MASSSVNENERNANTTAYTMSYSPFRFDSTTTIKSIQVPRSSGAWQSITKNELSDLELLILSIVYELQYCTASQVEIFYCFVGVKTDSSVFPTETVIPIETPSML